MDFNYLKTMDDDSLFARLEELLAKLNEMQEKDAVLSKAKDARELSNVAHLVDNLKAELDRYEEIKRQAKQDIRKAAESRENTHLAQGSDSETLALLHMYTDLSSSRLSSLQKAELNLKNILEQGTLTLDTPLEELALKDEAFFSLQEEVRTYQAEYLAVYEECKRRENIA